MGVEVHSEPQRRRYFATSCSCGTFFCVILWFVQLLVPLFLAYASHSFWVKDEFVFEQPEVIFQNKVLIIAEGTRDESGVSVPMRLVYTTSPHANELLGSSSVRAPILRYLPVDPNNDGRVDEFTLTASLPLQDTETVTSAHVQAFFDVNFHERAKVLMDGMLVASGSGVQGSSLDAAGVMTLHQLESFAATGGYFRPYNGRDLLDMDNAGTVTDLTPAAVATTYSRRNFTVSLHTPAPPVWTSATGAAVGGGQEHLASRPLDFTVALRVTVPPVQLWIRPPVSQVLKSAWIQYLAMFAAVYVVVQWFKSKLFGERVVQAYRRDDVPGGRKLHVS